MAKTIAFARAYVASPLETARLAIVAGCAAALIAAGPVIPFM